MLNYYFKMIPFLGGLWCAFLWALMLNFHSQIIRTLFHLTDLCKSNKQGFEVVSWHWESRVCVIPWFHFHSTAGSGRCKVLITCDTHDPLMCYFKKGCREDKHILFAADGKQGSWQQMVRSWNSKASGHEENELHFHKTQPEIHYLPVC